MKIKLLFPIWGRQAFDRGFVVEFLADATGTVVSPTSITCASPAGTGTVNVTVNTFDGGASATNSADQFTYTTAAPTAPAVTSISPSSGPAAGGTTVTITGTGFTGATVVMFGTLPGTNGSVNSDTSITTTSPAGSGVVDVTVITSSGHSKIL